MSGGAERRGYVVGSIGWQSWQNGRAAFEAGEPCPSAWPYLARGGWYERKAELAPYGIEAERLARSLTERTMGSGVPVGGYSPLAGLANALQWHASEAEESDVAPIGQWEAMLVALPRESANG